MRYEFPTDLTIDEVRDAVCEHNARTSTVDVYQWYEPETPCAFGWYKPLNQGTRAFIEADRGDHVIFNYIISFDGAFPFPNTGDEALDREYAILRECRGLTFHKATGSVRNRKYNKFFNVNEKPETQTHVIDWTAPHIVLEKLDGSMITPLYLGDDMDDIEPEALRWCTKMGITGVAAPVEDWITRNMHYARWSANVMYSGWTPIYEWCSRKQRIVIDHPEDRLVLTAVRNNKTGEYLPYSEMLKAETHGIEVVRALPGSVESIETFMSEVYDMEGVEGYIIRFDTGLMLKIKGMWYCQIHKTKEFLNLEKDVVALIANDKLDDLKPFMDVADRERVEAFYAAYEAGMGAYTAALVAEFDGLFERAAGNRKAFADLVNVEVPKGVRRSLMFSLSQGRDANEQVRGWVAKQAHPTAATQSRIDDIRDMFGGIRWDDYRDHNSVAGDD